MVLLWALTASLIFVLVRSLLTARHHRLAAARLHCLPPPDRHSTLPFGLSFLQLAIQADRKKRFPDFLQERFDSLQCATVRCSLFGTETYQTCDPKNIQAILATQFHDFSLGDRRKNACNPLLGSGIFTLDGRGWEHSRTMLRPQFAREQVSDLDLEERHVQNMMRALPVDGQGWIETDLQVLFFRLTLDSATEFLFGESVDSQIKEMPGYDVAADEKDRHQDESGFAQAFDESQGWLATRTRFQDLYWLVQSKGFRRSCDRTHRFVDHFVRLALSRPPIELAEEGKFTDEKKPKEKYVFLNALAAQTRDPLELRYQLLNILLAGRDTTASMLGWLFYLLARHPAVFTKLRATVLDTFGTYDAPREITFARLKACTYLQHVNNETLRLFPVVPANGRMAVRDTTMPRGGGPDGMSPIYVKAGQNVEYSVHVMHRRKYLWGPDAAEFKPERWEGRKVGWEYLPFNGGPRICIGQQFALTEASYVAVRLLQRFQSLENMDPEPVPKHNLSLTNCSATGVKVRMQEARKR